MKTFVTTVLEYKDQEKSPRFTSGMTAFGGEVVAVQFNDALSEIEELEKRIGLLPKMLAQAFMAGQADCGVDPSFSTAQVYATNFLAWINSIGEESK